MVTATNAANSLIGTANSTLSNPVTASQLSQDTFLKLMMAQMKNQDPFHAQDPSQFLSQLAQFSQVSGIQSMQKSLDTLSGSMRSSQALQGTALVGHTVLAPGATGDLAEGGALRGAVDVPTGTSAIDISVRDAAGALVNRFSVAPTGNLTEFTWNGAAEDGATAAPGKYRIQATAHIGNTNQSLNTLLQTRVDSVSVAASDGAMTLNTSSGSLTLAEVRQIL
jgi:flagellar basal-body rod modification protein FlgD